MQTVSAKPSAVGGDLFVPQKMRTTGRFRRTQSQLNSAVTCGRLNAAYHHDMADVTEGSCPTCLESLLLDPRVGG